jgi:hypothetical protein
MRSMYLSVLAERPHAFKQLWGGTFCEGIITPPPLTLNMRGTASHESVVKVNKQKNLNFWSRPSEPCVWDVIDLPELTKRALLVSRMPIAMQWIVRGQPAEDLRLLNITGDSDE